MVNPTKPTSPLLQPPPENSPEVSEAFRVLALTGETDVPTIPESLFKEHILPMLAQPAGTKVDLTKWLEVAGTPLRAIDVADDNSGNVLFRLPPLMRTLPTVYQQEVNYGNIVVGAQAREQIHPAQSDRYLQSELSKARTGATLLDVETAKTWNAIRARYGLPLIPLADGQGNVIHGSPNSNGDELSFSDDDEPFI